jgi:hypothetical protein
LLAAAVPVDLLLHIPAAVPAERLGAQSTVLRALKLHACSFDLVRVPKGRMANCMACPDTGSLLAAVLLLCIGARYMPASDSS